MGGIHVLRAVVSVLPSNGECSVRRCVLIAVAVFLSTAVLPQAAWAVSGNSGYLSPTAGSSPHGGYADNTEKCRTCHAVHHPSAGGERLLRSAVLDSCKYCHVSANFAIKTVFEEDSAYYSFDSERNHIVGCVGCHQVHDAANVTVPGSQSAYARSKLLRRPGSGGSYDTMNSSSVILGSTTLRSGLTDKAAVSAWCTQCHAYWNDAYDGDTHTMRAPSANYRGMGIAVATSSAATCRDCHQGGVTDVDWNAGTSSWTGKDAAGNDVDMTTGVGDLYQGTNNWPHFTTGPRFLKDDIPSGGSRKDQPCLDCHPGAGVSF